MAPTGINGNIRYRGHGTERVSLVFEDSQKIFHVENPTRDVVVTDSESKTTVDDVRGSRGKKYILKPGGTLRVVSRFTDSNKIQLEITSYNE